MPGDTFGPWKGDGLKPRREAHHSRAAAAGHNDSMKVLFLHGWQSIPGGVKPTFLAQHSHTVFNPALPDEDYEETTWCRLPTVMNWSAPAACPPRP